MSEEDFQADVIAYAKLKKWRHYHTYRSKKSTPGFPDLVLVSVERNRIVWMELKAEGGHPSAEQMNWMDDLKAVGEEVYMFHPSDWAEIERVLA